MTVRRSTANFAEDWQGR